jgi:hypothetical protein
VSERGFFAIDRGVWDHPSFAREKFSEREAWMWLISSAAWEPITVRIGRGSFDLERGQCVFALRFLATKWMWSEPRVRRFLKRLTDDAAVLVSATRDATLITICNYNEYQSPRRTDVSEIDAPLDQKSTNPRRKEEQPNNQTSKQITVDQQRKRAVRLPADAVPNERNVADATALGMTTSEIAQQWRRMRDWSASARNGACLDWNARWRNWCETFLGGRNGNRTGNSRASGHDAILAVAARKARELDRNDAMAGPAGAPGFAFGDDFDAAGSRGGRGPAEAGRGNHERVEPDVQRIREGEIIPPDKNAAGFPGRRQFV